MIEVECPYCPKKIRTKNNNLAKGILNGSLAHHIKSTHPGIWKGSITKTMEAHPATEAHRKVCTFCEEAIEPLTIEAMEKHLEDEHDIKNLGVVDVLRMFIEV